VKNQIRAQGLKVQHPEMIALATAHNFAAKDITLRAEEWLEARRRRGWVTAD
jgi:hypothetical protein